MTVTVNDDDVKCEEHEGLMLLFMTLSSSFLAAARGILQGDFACVCTPRLFLTFLGRRTLFLLETYLPPFDTTCLFLRHKGIEEFFFRFDFD
jgi:hypothetical protein